VNFAISYEIELRVGLNVHSASFHYFSLRYSILDQLNFLSSEFSPKDHYQISLFFNKNFVFLFRIGQAVLIYLNVSSSFS
jgi:hypothetical protein